MQAKALVIVRPHPFGRIDCSFFKGRINFAAGDIGCNTTESLPNPSWEPTRTKLDALDIGYRFNFFTPPSAHLGTGIPHREHHDVVLPEKLAHEGQAIALVKPGRHLTRVEAKRDGAPQSKDRVFAEVVVTSRSCALHRTLLDGIDCPKRRNDLARGMG